MKSRRVMGGKVTTGCLQQTTAIAAECPSASCVPRSANRMPEPETRSLTVLETRISPACAAEAMRAPVCTAMPCDLAARQLDLARVQAGPDLEAERAHGVADAAGAADRASRPVERREEAVAGRVDLAPTECARAHYARSRDGASSSSLQRAVAELVPRAASSRRCPSRARWRARGRARARAGRRSGTPGSRPGSRPGRRPRACGRRPAARRSARPGICPAIQRPSSTWTLRSPVRCMTRVGTWIAGSTCRTSISEFMRRSATAAPGLAALRK